MGSRGGVKEVKKLYLYAVVVVVVGVWVSVVFKALHYKPEGPGIDSKR